MVDQSYYVGIIPSPIEYSISMQLNENLPIWTIVANKRGNDIKLPFSAA